MHRSTTHAFLAVLCVSIAACGGGSGDPEPVVVDGDGVGEGLQDPGVRDDPAEPDTWFQSYVAADGVEVCSTDDLKAWVDHDMHDYYVYADRSPNLRLSDYTDEVELIRALRVEPDSFSSVRDAGQYTAFFDEGTTLGFGYRWRTYQNEVRFFNVKVNSPAERAGLLRGDTLVALDGIPADALREADYDRIFDVDDGVAIRFTVRTGTEAPRDLLIAREQYVLDTVPFTQHVFYPPTNRSVGYLVVDTFIEPTDAKLDAEIAWLAERNVTELVLDLRYNGGGRSRVANRLAARIGGAAVQGQVYSVQSRNATYSAFDETNLFRDVDRALSLSRVVILTTSSTASASENLTNALRPYMDVAVIGDRTRGKSFSSQSIFYCDKAISAMNSTIANSAGVSAAGGIPADCQVRDTPDFAFGEAGDALYDAALAYLADGSCETTPLAKVDEGAPLPEDPSLLPLALDD